MCGLAEKNVCATGIIRENRTGGANKKLYWIQRTQKKERGNFDYCTDDKISVAKWHENSVVTMANNWENSQSLAQSKSSGKRR